MTTATISILKFLSILLILKINNCGKNKYSNLMVVMQHQNCSIWHFQLEDSWISLNKSFQQDY